LSPPGRPKGEYRRAQLEGSPLSAEAPEAACGADEVLAQLAALREAGAVGFDPVRAAFIASLARRTQAQHGPTRQLLEAKLAPLMADYQARRAAAAVSATPLPGAAPPRSGPLAELLQHAARAGAGSAEALQTASAEAPAISVAAAMVPAAPAELKSLRQFRSTWSRLSVQVRLTQSVAKGPENAGPLNSHGLALRALQGMQEMAPDYLEHFMAYFEALQWLDKAAGSVTLPPARAAAPAAEAPRKPPRKKAG
jgi:Protein of unknown function (DUF2894)